jgi:hypothetical protein
LGDAAGIGDEQPFIDHDQRFDLRLGKGECGIHLLESPHFHALQCDIQSSSRLLHSAQTAAIAALSG